MGRGTRQTSWWEFVTCHPRRMKTDEVFCRKVGEVSCLLALVLMGDYNKQEQMSADIQHSKEEKV